MVDIVRKMGFAKPALDSRELEAVKGVLESGWLGLGPQTERFEVEFARRMGARFAVGTNSGTSALHLGLLVAGVGPKDEVLVPTITFLSSAHAVSYCGAKPVFVDVDPHTLNIDVKDMEKKLTRRTRAIMPVHYGGLPCEMNRIWGFASRRGIAVVEDACHACGASYRGQHIGNSNSVVVCFSFDPIKNLTSAEGGMVLVKEPELERELKSLRNLGREYVHGGDSWDYRARKLGFRYHMNDVAAAIGRVQLEKLKIHNGKRNKIAGLYDEGFKDLVWLELPPKQPDSERVYFNYVVKVRPPLGRTNLARFLEQRGIGTGLHYKPLHLHEYYFRRRVKLPTAERVWPTLLTLPMHPGLSADDVQWVIESMREFEGRGTR
jgi:perosamine synthetase